MVKTIYVEILEIFKKLPFKLWGITLLSVLLSVLALALGVNVPIISIPLVAALNAGMYVVYFAAYKNGGEACMDKLFAAFSDVKTFKRVAGGMCWMYLWILLWALIPVAGIFFAVYKSIQYAFTPFILTHEPQVSGRAALKKSIEDTNGYKGKLFVGIFLPVAAFAVASVILSLLGLIPYAGVVFMALHAILLIVWYLLSPLFFGLVNAGFYDYGKKPVNTAKKPTPVLPAAKQGENVCPTCGTENGADKKFCMHCGAKL